MKFTPTLSLALVLAAGVSAVALAQTATTQTPSTYPASQPQATTTEPMPSGYNTMRPGTQEPPANTGQIQQGSNTTQTAPATTAAPSAAASTAAGIANNANEQVRNAQQRLQAAGLYNGPVDGVMDPDTRAAIARFQQQNGLQRTSNLDDATLARLMSSQASGSGSTAAPSAAAAPEPTGAGASNPAPSTQTAR